jgi:negative regulator of sigma E activity
VASDRETRLRDAAAEAKAANAAGDIWAAQAAWDRYQLIRDAQRSPDERLEEAISLSRQVEQIARSPR